MFTYCSGAINGKFQKQIYADIRGETIAAAAISDVRS